MVRNFALKSFALDTLSESQPDPNLFPTFTELLRQDMATEADTFLVFLPFLVVDLVVANVLLALGLNQLSPTSVSLPLQLLLLVTVDGWRLLARALAVSYGG